MLAPPPLDARASDPVVMGWMIGSPPPPDKLVRFEDDSWLQFPQRRWSVSHVRELMPTRVVARGQGAIAELPRAERGDIDAVTFKPIGRDSTMTWQQSPANVNLDPTSLPAYDAVMRHLMTSP